MVRYALAFFVGVAAVLHAFSFNDCFIEIVFAALDKFGAISDKPESRSFGHYNQSAINVKELLINVAVTNF